MGSIAVRLPVDLERGVEKREKRILLGPSERPIRLQGIFRRGAERLKLFVSIVELRRMWMFRWWLISITTVCVISSDRGLQVSQNTRHVQCIRDERRCSFAFGFDLCPMENEVDYACLGYDSHISES